MADDKNGRKPNRGGGSGKKTQSGKGPVEPEALLGKGARANPTKPVRVTDPKKSKSWDRRLDLARRQRTEGDEAVVSRPEMKRSSGSGSADAKSSATTKPSAIVRPEYRPEPVSTRFELEDDDENGGFVFPWRVGLVSVVAVGAVAAAVPLLNVYRSYSGVAIDDTASGSDGSTAPVTGDAPADTETVEVVPSDTQSGSVILSDTAPITAPLGSAVITAGPDPLAPLEEKRFEEPRLGENLPDLDRWLDPGSARDTLFADRTSERQANGNTAPALNGIDDTDVLSGGAVTPLSQGDGTGVIAGAATRADGDWTSPLAQSSVSSDDVETYALRHRETQSEEARLALLAAKLAPPNSVTTELNLAAAAPGLGDNVTGPAKLDGVVIAGLPQRPDGAVAPSAAPEAVAELAPVPAVPVVDPAQSDAPGSDGALPLLTGLGAVAVGGVPLPPGAQAAPSGDETRTAALTPVPTPTLDQADRSQLPGPSAEGDAPTLSGVTGVAVAEAPIALGSATTPEAAPTELAALTPLPETPLSEVAQSAAPVGESDVPAIEPARDVAIAALIVPERAGVPAAPGVAPRQGVALTPGPAAPLSDLARAPFLIGDVSQPSVDPALDSETALASISGLSTVPSGPSTLPRQIAAMTPSPASPFSGVSRGQLTAFDTAQPDVVSGSDAQIAGLSVPLLSTAPSGPSGLPRQIAAMTPSPASPFSGVSRGQLAAFDTAQPDVGPRSDVQIAIVSAPLLSTVPSGPSGLPSQVAAMTPSPASPFSGVSRGPLTAFDTAQPDVALGSDAQIAGASAPALSTAPSGPSGLPTQIAAMTPSPAAPFSEGPQAQGTASVDLDLGTAPASDTQIDLAGLQGQTTAPAGPSSLPTEIAGQTPAPAAPLSTLSSGLDPDSSEDNVPLLMGLGAVSVAGMPARLRVPERPTEAPDQVAGLSALPTPSLQAFDLQQAPSPTPAPAEDALSTPPASDAEVVASIVPARPDLPERSGLPETPAAAPALSSTPEPALALASSLRPRPRPVEVALTGETAPEAASAEISDPAVALAETTTGTDTTVPALGAGVILSIYAPDGLGPDTMNVAASWAALNGIENVSTDLVAFTVKTTNVRYYHAADKAAAEKIAAATQSDVRDFTDFGRLPPEGSIELWLAGDSQMMMTSKPAPKAAKVKAAAKPTVVAAVATPAPAKKQGFLARIFGNTSASTGSSGARQGDMQSGSVVGSQVASAAVSRSGTGSGTGSGSGASGGGGSAASSAGSAGSSGGSTGGSSSASRSNDNRVQNVRSRVNNALNR